MANQTITQLPDAGPITGTELVPIVQNGGTYKTTTAAISASPSQNQTFLTINQQTTLPNSRFLSTGTGLGLVDGGAQSFYRITLNGVSGTLESMGNGFGVNVNGIMTSRSIASSGAGLSVNDGGGQSGNPTISLNGIMASLANNGGTGFLALPGNGSVSGRTLTGTANQINITNPNGIAGSPEFSIADNPVLPGDGSVHIPSGSTADRPILPSDGMIRYNTDLALFEGYINGAWTVFSSGSSGVVSISTGTGLTGGPITSTGTISIANTAVTAGSYGGAAKTLSATVNAQGQLTALSETNIAISNAQVSGLGTMSTQDAGSVAITGGAINATSIGATTPSTGAFTSVAMSTGTIATAPSNGNDIVNKSYADAIASGINFHQSCRLATTTALPANTYNNGTSGVGATLTANANGALSVDSVAVAAGNRILVKNEVAGANNGVYTVTQTGSAGTPYILTRATDFDSAGTGVDQIDAGDFFLITAGASLANTSWVQQTPLPITVGTTAIVFQQFGAPITYSPGTGLTESPSYTFNIANTAVTSGSYGSGSAVGTFSVNAQGQLTSAVNVPIAIANTQVTGLGTMSTQNANSVSITGGAIDGATVGATTAATVRGTTVTATSDFSGPGTNLTGTAAGLSIGGSAATATTATNATNVATTATSTNANFFIPFVSASTTGNQALGVDAGITYNPSTNALTASINGGTF